jgi:phage gp36-like protein
MAYALLTDLEERFGVDEINQLSDRDNDGVNDVGVVDGALDDATDEINSYLARKYTVPVVSVSANLKKTCCDIARYLLHGDAATEEVEKRYKRAVAWLNDLASGKAVLTDASGVVTAIAGTSTSGVKSFSNDRLFTDESLASY